MPIKEPKSIIEAILFASGRAVKINELINILELSKNEIEQIIEQMQQEYKNEDKGIEIIKINDTYQMCTKKDYFEYIYPLFDNRTKPKLSNAALEILSIIAYNENITRAEIDNIRGVSSDGTIYKLLEYDMIEEARKIRTTRKTNDV